MDVFWAMVVPHWPSRCPGHFWVTLELILGTGGVFFDACRLQELKRRAGAGAPNQNRFFIDFGVYPKARRRVLAAAGALFSLWRPVANNGDFGLHFGVILGAQSSTILTLGFP